MARRLQRIVGILQPEEVTQLGDSAFSEREDKLSPDAQAPIHLPESHKDCPSIIQLQLQHACAGRVIAYRHTHTDASTLACRHRLMSKQPLSGSGYLQSTSVAVSSTNLESSSDYVVDRGAPGPGGDCVNHPYANS